MQAQALSALHAREYPQNFACKRVAKNKVSVLRKKILSDNSAIKYETGKKIGIEVPFRLGRNLFRKKSIEGSKQQS